MPRRPRIPRLPPPPQPDNFSPQGEDPPARITAATPPATETFDPATATQPTAMKTHLLAALWLGAHAAALADGAAAGLTARAQLGAARATVQDGVLSVTTGAMERVWTWTGKGWLTRSVRDAATNQTYAVNQPAHACDWDLPGLIDDRTDGQLLGVEARVADDDGFTGQHVEVVSTVLYPTAGVEVRHVVWVYPGAPGVRVQLRARSVPGFKAEAARVADLPFTSYGSSQLAPGARADYLPLDLSLSNSRRYWGYCNDPGNRLPQDKPMLEEKVITGYPLFQSEVVTWASGAAVQYGAAGADHGVLVVKESPKTVNQPAHLTGGFFTSPQGVSVTGWGLAPGEITADRFRECWATWSLVYSGGNDGLQLALKRFDAARYPVVVARDMILLSNTWGAANPNGDQFTSEEFVTKEIAAVGRLGIEVMQIDDGWQKSGGGSDARQFLPKYPNGWQDIKAAAAQAGVRMGLWVAIRNAEMADLKQDLDDLGSISWKADFEHLASRGDYEDRTAKYREVMKHAWGKTQFTLCPEYDDPRYGWYYAREYGSTYFQNIQEGLPIHLTFVPYQVLRQHWLMAKYFPANKLQVMLQNPQRTRKDVSDAGQHSHGYCFAMGLPFVPCFFQSGQFLDPAGQKELAALIQIYKRQREDMFTSTTFPIGDEPDNASWSGFQMVSTRQPGSGHLLLFRELHNAAPNHRLALKFLAGQAITLTDTQTGGSRSVTAGDDGGVEFEIAQPADYRLYQYSTR